MSATTLPALRNVLSCPKCLRDLALTEASDPANPNVTHRGRCTHCGTVVLAVEGRQEDGSPALEIVSRRAPRPQMTPAPRRRARSWK